jgi:hypothetical protein
MHVRFMDEPMAAAIAAMLRGAPSLTALHLPPRFSWSVRDGMPDTEAELKANAMVLAVARAAWRLGVAWRLALGALLLRRHPLREKHTPSPYFPFASPFAFALIANCRHERGVIRRQRGTTGRVPVNLHPASARPAIPRKESHIRV